MKYRVLAALALACCFAVPAEARGHHHRHYASSGEVVVAHPSGCPAVAFCGCGAAVRIFGTPVRSLWLASNWFRFPRTSPAPMTAAVRSHHVFVLLEPRGGDKWLVYDANSGHHATQIHERSIAGYAIVNPRAA